MFRSHLRPDDTGGGGGGGGGGDGGGGDGGATNKMSGSGDEGQGSGNNNGEEYPVLANHFVCIGREVDFNLRLSEVAPPQADDDAAGNGTTIFQQLPPCPVDDATSVMLQGVQLARDL
eukprot:UC4_evm1s791